MKLTFVFAFLVVACALFSACGGSQPTATSASEAPAVSERFASELTVTEMVEQCLEEVGSALERDSLTYLNDGTWSAQTDDTNQIMVVLASNGSEIDTSISAADITESTTAGDWRIVTDSPIITNQEMTSIGACLEEIPDAKAVAPDGPEQFGEQKLTSSDLADIESDSQSWLAAAAVFVDAVPECTPPSTAGCIDAEWENALTQGSDLIDLIDKAITSLGDGPCKASLETWRNTVVKVTSATGAIREAVDTSSEDNFRTALDDLETQAQGVADRDELLAKC
jgi:hypothetical protein